MLEKCSDVNGWEGILIPIFILLVGGFRGCYVDSVMACFDLQIIIEKGIELVLP